MNQKTFDTTAAEINDNDLSEAAGGARWRHRFGRRRYPAVYAPPAQTLLPGAPCVGPHCATPVAPVAHVAAPVIVRRPWGFRR